jgi:hypothetical protein
MIIDVHGHLVPPDLLAAIRKEGRGFPSLRLTRTAPPWRSPLPAASHRGQS